MAAPAPAAAAARPVTPSLFPLEPGAAQAPTYFAVLFIDPMDGDAPAVWSAALRMLATLAEEIPGYLGYEVREMEGGREYAVTHWESPAHIRQWKRACALVIGDTGLLSRVYGREGCLWPWLESGRQA
ncbi:MAG: hypothetical protein COW30_00085 [Rhodospirillales bacterium CG15_BIG_FIL_POST_REV_8_21_14_020_66_15]|nr:MAG: hypothetical protein COW30_00085 [Rhodospirillales bacterium CG15_BIG_FIL_POST_REV_8_21_14_020_66_15]